MYNRSIESSIRKGKLDLQLRCSLSFELLFQYCRVAHGDFEPCNCDSTGMYISPILSTHLLQHDDFFWWFLNLVNDKTFNPFLNKLASSNIHIYSQVYKFKFDNQAKTSPWYYKATLWRNSSRPISNYETRSSYFCLSHDNVECTDHYLGWVIWNITHIMRMFAILTSLREVNKRIK